MSSKFSLYENTVSKQGTTFVLFLSRELWKSLLLCVVFAFVSGGINIVFAFRFSGGEYTESLFLVGIMCYVVAAISLLLFLRFVVLFIYGIISCRRAKFVKSKMLFIKQPALAKMLWRFPNTDGKLKGGSYAVVYYSAPFCRRYVTAWQLEC